MNRRRFIQSVVAVFSLPAMPSLAFRSVAPAAPAAVAVPTQARFWGIYMTALHGECPPHALQTLLNVPAADAQKYVTQLVAEGVIKPNPLLQKSVSQLVKSNDDSLLGKIKKRLDMKAQADREEVEVSETIDDFEDLDAEPELAAELPETDLEVAVEDSVAELEPVLQDEAEKQS